MWSIFGKKKAEVPSPDVNLSEHKAIIHHLMRVEASLSREIGALYTLLNDRMAEQIEAEKKRARRITPPKTIELEEAPKDPFYEIRKREGLI